MPTKSTSKSSPSAGSPVPVRLSGLSIVVPVFNEQETLADVLQAAWHTAADVAEEFEIIVVDDGSADESGAIAARFAEQCPQARVITHEQNRGFGAAQKTGFAAARLEYVSVIPSDGQFDAEDLRPMARSAPQQDIVIGCRGRRGDGLYRTVKTRIFYLTMRWMFGVPFRDINWVKLYRRSVLDQIEIRSSGIGIEAEMIVKALRQRLRLCEVDVGYLPRKAGVAKGDQPLRVMKTLRELLWLRLGLLG